MGAAVKRICTICARGGSKGVSGKNLRKLRGRPLLSYSIDRAVGTGLFDAIAVSSDSDAILEVARECGVQLLVARPAYLATDESPKLPVIRHCVGEVERRTGETPDVIVDLDATSPLRSVDDIRGAVALLEGSQAGNVITAMPSRKSPYFNLVELRADGTVGLSKPPSVPIVRRQDAPPCFDMNASIYVWRRSVLFESDAIINPHTRLYVMPEERSVDIDSELDFAFVEFMLSRGLDLDAIPA